MIPAYNKKRCAAFPFETGIHFRRKTDFFSEEDTTKSYSGFEPEPTRLQAEGHSHHTGWATFMPNKVMLYNSENKYSIAEFTLNLTHAQRFPFLKRKDTEVYHAETDLHID
ncbi:poly polymerase [Trichonephila clavipes]|nr:poly polymerase [Trichonephila clavipes]